MAGRVRRRGATGGVRGVVAGLLVLALLALSAAPAPAAPSPGRAAMQDCNQSGGPALLAAAPPDRGQPDRNHHGTAPALACCIAAQCPMLLGAPPMSLDRCPLPAGPPVLSAAPAHDRAGIDTPPALPPPRAA